MASLTSRSGLQLHVIIDSLFEVVHPGVFGSFLHEKGNNTLDKWQHELTLLSKRQPCGV